MVSRNQVSLTFRNQAAPRDGRRKLSWRGFTTEHVVVPGGSEFSYSWVGSTHYLAVHDLKLADGEISLDDVGNVRMLDLRNRMTFVPKGCTVSGWSRVSNRQNAFTALYYDPAVIPEELESLRAADGRRPMLYFDDGGLRSTLGKIETLLKAEHAANSLYAETLALLAALELERLQGNAAFGKIPASGGLSLAQERLLRGYISENLCRDISLGELAALVKLSRFHFARAFRKTFSLPPHQFILRARIELAKTMLLRNSLPVQQIAEELGFANQGHLAAAFRRLTGHTPGQFRRGNL